MSATSVAQINVRLSRDLKESGDEGLKALGLSPSDAIRALWTRLSSRGEDLKEVQTFLLGEEQGSSVETSFEQSELARGWSMVDHHIARLGMTADVESVQWSATDDNDFVAQEMELRMQERGLM